MKKYILCYLTGCIIFIFNLFLYQYSYSQTQTVPVKFDKITNSNSEIFTVSNSTIPDRYLTKKTGAIQPGKWIASTGTGFDFEFVINDDATKITQFKLIFTEWKCGSVTHGGSVTISSTWSITNNQFSVNLTLNYSPLEKFTIAGKFNNSGVEAAGTWNYTSNFGNCSGSWNATPEGGIIELSDLIITSLDFNPAKGMDGTILNVNVSVKNNGSASSGSSILKYYLSTNDVISDADIKIGEVDTDELSSGDTVNKTINWTIPQSLANGIYFIGCIIDADNQVNESNENNNIYLSDQKFEKLAQGMPNLIVTNCGFQPDEGGVGTILNISATIKNNGFVSADTSTLAFYLCRDPNVAVAELLIGTVPVSALNIEEEKSVELMYEITSDLTAGEYHVGYKTDHFDSIEELEEGIYYYLTVPFTRLPDPDLTITSLNFSPAYGRSKDNMNVNVVIKNIDAGNSGQFSINYYLSTDTVISESDFLIGTTTISNLESNQETTAGINWTVQSTLSEGIYYVGCIVDAANQVVESDETNNTFFNYPGQFSKNDPPFVKAFSPIGTLNTAKDSKPELKITFSEKIQEGEGCLRIFQKLPDGTEKLVRDKQCWEGKIVGDTMKFRLSFSLDSFAVHYVLIEPGFVKDLTNNPFEGISDKSAWIFKTGDFPTGLFTESNIKNVKIFPNPASGELNVELVNVKIPYSFKLINIAGQVVVQKEFYSTYEKVNLNDLSSGLYLLKIYNQNFSKTEKLTIQK